MDEKFKDFVYKALQTGKSLSAKLKDKKKENTILSYDGADAFYSDEKDFINNNSPAQPAPSAEENVVFEDAEQIENFNLETDHMKVTMNNDAPSGKPQEQHTAEVPSQNLDSEKSPLRAVVDNIKDKIPGFSGINAPDEEILFDQDARQFEEENEAEIEEEEELAQDAFLYYQGLSEKIENLKQILSEKLNEKLKKEKDETLYEKLDYLPVQFEKMQSSQMRHIIEVLDEQKMLLQEIFTQSGDHFKAILTENAQKLQKTASELEQAVSAFDACAKNRLDSLSDSMSSLYDTVRDISNFVTSINSQLLQNGEKINEIHSAATSVTKLNDSVFELKTANVDLKNAIEQISESYKALKKKCTAGFIILGILTLAGIALQIVQLVA